MIEEPGVGLGKIKCLRGVWILGHGQCLQIGILQTHYMAAVATTRTRANSIEDAQQLGPKSDSDEYWAHSLTRSTLRSSKTKGVVLIYG